MAAMSTAVVFARRPRAIALRRSLHRPQMCARCTRLRLGDHYFRGNACDVRTGEAFARTKGWYRFATVDRGRCDLPCPLGSDGKSVGGGAPPPFAQGYGPPAQNGRTGVGIEEIPEIPPMASDRSTRPYGPKLSIYVITTTVTPTNKYGFLCHQGGWAGGWGIGMVSLGMHLLVP
eukprot:gene14131-biopygen11131